MEIENSIALVTGANRGIGRAFVEALLDAGASKVYATARDVSKLDDLADDARVIPLALDVTNTAQIEAVAEAASDVTLLINNAGAAGFAGLIAASDIEAARTEMEINYFGLLNTTRAFTKALANNGGGAIVNIASIASYVNFPALGSYSASKAAVHSLTQGIRAELAAQRTQVVGVYPGPIDTDMTASIPMEKTSPLDVVKAVLAGVEAGTDDVYPDPVSAEMHAGILSNFKAVEAQAGEMLPE